MALQRQRDDLNLVEFGPLKRRTLGFACHWHANNDVNRKMIESDIRINESKNDAVFYAQGPRLDDCHQGEPGARFDLRSSDGRPSAASRETTSNPGSSVCTRTATSRKRSAASTTSWRR